MLPPLHNTPSSHILVGTFTRFHDKSSIFWLVSCFIALFYTTIQYILKLVWSRGTTLEKKPFIHDSEEYLLSIFI